MDAFKNILNKRFVIIPTGNKNKNGDKEIIFYDVEKDVTVASKHINIKLMSETEEILKISDFFKDKKEKYLNSLRRK